MKTYFEFNEKLILQDRRTIYFIISYLLNPFMLRIFASWAEPVPPGGLAMFWIFSPITFPAILGGYLIYIIDIILRIGL